MATTAAAQSATIQSAHIYQELDFPQLFKRNKRMHITQVAGDGMHDQVSIKTATEPEIDRQIESA